MSSTMGTHKTWTPNLDPQSGPPYGPQYGPPSKTTKFGLDRQPFPKIVGKVGKACNWLITAVWSRNRPFLAAKYTIQT